MPEIFLNRVFFLVRAKTSKGAYFTMQKVILVCILPTICSKVFFLLRSFVFSYINICIHRGHIA